MQFICDAPGRRTWFRIETEAEAAAESETMHHAVEKYFRRESDAAISSYRPTATSYIERDIGLKAHILRTMPLFLTLREHDGTPIATAMLPPNGKEFDDFRMIIVGPSNGDPFATHDEAMQALATHYGLTLNRERCFPYTHYGV